MIKFIKLGMLFNKFVRTEIRRYQLKPIFFFSIIEIIY